MMLMAYHVYINVQSYHVFVMGYHVYLYIQSILIILDSGCLQCRWETLRSSFASQTRE